MSFSYNSSTINLQEYYYLRIGSTWIIDSLYMFIVLPEAFIALFLSLISFVCFMNKDFDRLLIYKYLRIFTFNNFLQNLIGMFCFITYSQRYFIYGDSYVSRIYRCKVTNYVLNTFYFFGNVLDVVIVIERLSKFSPKQKGFEKFSSMKLSINLLILCLTINLPMAFVYYVKNDQEFYSYLHDFNTLLTFTYCGREPFFTTIAGKGLILLTVFLRDIITLIFEFVISLYAIIKFKNFINRRSKLISTVPIIPHASLNSQVLVHYSATKKPRKIDMNVTDGSVANTSRSNLNKPKKTVQADLHNMNKRLTKMSLVIAVQSFLTHLATFLHTAVFLIFDNTIIAQYFGVSNFIIVGVKQIFNFLSFYYMNPDFKHLVRNLFTFSKTKSRKNN